MPGAPAGRGRDRGLAVSAGRGAGAILAEARTAWDREHFVSKLPAKLEAIIRRRHA